MTLPEMAGYFVDLPPKEYEKLIRELIEWTSAERGRQQQLAEHLKVSRKTVNSWVKRTRRRVSSYFSRSKLSFTGNDEKNERGTPG